MKLRWKQIGSLILSLCMVFTILLGAGFAAEGDEFTLDNLNYKVLTEDSGAKTGTVALVGYPVDNEPTGTLTVADAVYNEGINYSIIEIGEDAFSWCDDLTSIVIGDNVENIGKGAFKLCSTLTDIKLGNAVKSIGEDAFDGCEKLTGFTVDGANPNFSAEDGVLLSKDKKSLILYPAGKTGETYTIPDSVKTIGEKAFAGNGNITQIVTKNVVTIGKSAFEGSKLVTIDIGDSLVTIGEKAFYSCADLTGVNFSANSSLEAIGDGVFGYCESLGKINLPDSLKSLGKWVFGGSELESISIGKNVASIGAKAIYNVRKLKTLTVDTDNANYMAEDNILYNKGKTTLIRYAPSKPETNFEISNTVTKIEECAFYGAGNLINVTVPNSVTNIGDEAFFHSDFKSITFLGNTPPSNIGNDIFNFCNYLTNIYVPESSVDAYKTALGTEYAVKVKTQSDATAHTATLNINLDDSPFTNQYGSYKLKLDGNESTTFAMNGSGATRTAEVPNGTWKVYENFIDIYTGVNITINDAPASGILDYYTVKYSVTKEGTTSEGRVELSVTTLDGEDLDNMSYIIKGDKASFAATGMGAESYTYRWSGTHGTETISSTGSIYTINHVQGKIDITCTITGTGISSGPIPGNSEIITVTDITQNSLTLNWTNATEVAPGNLSYYVFQSKSANISTVGECMNHPELLLNGEPININTYAVSGLSPNTTYYFNVIVADDNMGVAAYKMVSAKTTGSGGSGGSSSGGSSSGGSTTPPTTTKPDEKPNQPATVSATITATAGKDGKASAIIPDKTIIDAIAKAQVDAKAQGETAKGISVVLNTTMPQGATSLTLTLTQEVLSSLVNAGVTSLEINGTLVSLGFDLAALKEIQKQSDENISINIALATGLSNEAKAIIGNRPVYNINLSYTKDNKSATIFSFGAGRVLVTIPYTLGKNEKAGNVQAIHIDTNGQVQWILDSVYDNTKKVLHFSTNHFSIYGVGYKQDRVDFTDIDNHWAKDDILFVINKGLFSGTSKTTFSPNTAMTRGMFVTVLGRLANADVDSYKKSSFTDVKSDLYYMGYIEWANKSNIIKGIGNGKFAPDQPITREQMAVIMKNYAKNNSFTLPKVHTENIFADKTQLNTYAKDAVKEMQMAGVISGKDGNLFDPQGTATRAEVSAVLCRFVELAIPSDPF